MISLLGSAADLYLESLTLTYEPLREKSNNLGFRPGLIQLACTVTDAGLKLETSELRRRGLVLSV